MFSFKLSAFPLLKGGQTPLSNSKKVSPIDPVFSKWVNVNFNKKFVHHKLFYNFKELYSHLFFFFENQKLQILEKPAGFFSVSLRSFLFSKFQLAMFVSVPADNA